MLWLMTAYVGLFSGQVPLPGTSSVSVPLSPPNACGRCHRPIDESDAGGIYDTWVGSVMGHATRDPVFLAALTLAENDAPGMGDLCLRCHAPEAWLEERCIETNGAQLTELDSGVTCSVCHRMLPNPYLRNAQYIVADDSIMRGPYEVTDAPHRHERSDWISDARLCGTCHDFLNPLVFRRTLDGALTNMFFPEQTTYSEWVASAFPAEGRDCKSCHLPERSGQIADTGMIRPDRSDHGIAGANTFLLDAIDFLHPELGIATQLALGRARNVEMLRSAATLELIDAPQMVRRGERYSITVRVTNETGHKLPSGYPEGRRVILALRTSTTAPVLDAFGEPIGALEIYRTDQGQLGVGPGPHLALNDTIYFDNRLPPRGMIPTATIAPVGKIYPEVSPGVLAHWDDVVYTATVPCDVAVTELDGEIVLYYEVLTRQYAEQLIDANGILPRADALRSAFETLNPQPIEMESVSFLVTIDPLSVCAPPDAGFPDLGATDNGARDVASEPRDAGVSTPDAGTDPDVGGGCGCSVSTRKKQAGDGLTAAGVLMFLLVGSTLRRRRRFDVGS